MNLVTNSLKETEASDFNSEAKSYSKLSELRLLTIGLASPQKIRQWAEKTLPNGKIFGQVTSPNTLHHKTFKPQRGGLFCERIFGPLRDFECACRKISKPTEEERQKFLKERKLERRFCPECDVEYTWSVMRRYQLGYISLILPVTHLWYLKATPSYLSILLDSKKRHLESVVYCSETLTLENSQKAFSSYNLATSPKNLINSWKKVLAKLETKDFSKPFPSIERPASTKNLKKIIPQRLENWREIPSTAFFQPSAPPHEKMNGSSTAFNEKKFAQTSYVLPASVTLTGLQNQIPSSNNLTIPSYIYCRLHKLSTQRALFLSLKHFESFMFKKFYKKISQFSTQWLWANREKYFKKSLPTNSLYFQVSMQETDRFQETILDEISEKNFSIYKLKKEMLETNFEYEDQTSNEKRSLKMLQIYFIKKCLTIYQQWNLLDSFANEHSTRLKEPFMMNFLSFLNPNFSLEKNTNEKAQVLAKGFLKTQHSLFKGVQRKLASIVLFNNLQKLQSLPNEPVDFSFAEIPKKEWVLLFDKEWVWKKESNIGKLELISDRNSASSFDFNKNSKTLKTNVSFLDCYKWMNSGRKFQKVTESQIEESKKSKIHKKVNIYNNIYTLSHRYRWENDKDWNLFLYYSYAEIHYGDFPIFHYENRVDTSRNSSLIGAGLIQKMLQEFDFDELRKIDKQNRIFLYEFQQKLLSFKNLMKKGMLSRENKKDFKTLVKQRDLLMRRTKLIRKLFRKNANPEWMTLTVLPVLPPELRPIIKIQDQIAASDLNRLYQRVLYRNERLRKFLKDPSTIYSTEMKYAQRLLQEAVDNLIDNGKGGGTPERDSRGRNLKSLSEILKGKQGRFRQHLLGKRVDYSGRSVIVVSPKLKIHECGLPKEMAFELFLPFLIQRILHLNLARTVIGAKNFLRTQKEMSFEILKELLQGHPVLLNRAPTLHRLGIQAFQPKLIEGRAILLHPLVCSAFNADFDGDQMAVHVPITVEARAEAWKLLFARNHLLSPATGEPMLLPSQDMVLGCYYLTSENVKPLKLAIPPIFSNFMQVFSLYQQGKLPLQMPIWVKWNSTFELGLEKNEPLEIRVTKEGVRLEIFSKYQRSFNENGQPMNQIICTTPGRILLHFLLQEAKKEQRL